MHFLEKPHILETLKSLIRIPSINPHLSDDKSDNEMKLAKCIQGWLESRNIFARTEEVEPGRANVYAEIGNGKGPTLCLCSHLDTVAVNEMTISPFDPAVDGNKVYGRGSCDMKGGLAAILSMTASFAQQPFNGKLILALVCDEEYASIGADDFVRKYRADACILTEPSDLHMVVAHKGFLWGKVTATGKSAHGSRWDLGKSAITTMGPILTALDDLDKNQLRKRAHPIVGPASMHVSLINGGTGISTYASECTIHIERRTLPSENIGDVKRELEEVIAKNCADAVIEWYFYRPPFECNPEEKIAKSMEHAFQHVMGTQVERRGFGMWTDAAIFQNAGIPTVNLGPAGFGLHEPVEWVDLDSVVQTAKILYHTAKTFFS